MLKQTQDPYGYRKLLVYKRSAGLLEECTKLTSTFPYSKTLKALQDQMDRSARSVKQNIVEGWTRNSTGEYYQFLGFAIASNAELEEDCVDIWNGVYADLEGTEMMGGGEIQGVKGEKGRKEVQGDKEVNGRNKENSREEIQRKNTPDRKNKYKQTAEERKRTIDIDKLPFFPIDKNLPKVVQLLLRAREVNYLIAKLQKSLTQKMQDDHTLSQTDKLKQKTELNADNDVWIEDALAERGLERLPNGQIVKKRKDIQRNKGVKGRKGENAGE